MGELVNKRRLASLLGYKERTLTNLQNEGLPIDSKGKRGQPNQYDSADVIAWLIDREVQKALDGKSRADQGNQDEINAEYESARWTRARADNQEMKNQVERGELEPAEIIRLVLEKVSVQMAAALDTIPLKVKRRIPKLSASELEVIKREVIKAQNLAAKASVSRDELSEYQQDDQAGSIAAEEAGAAESC